MAEGRNESKKDSKNEGKNDGKAEGKAEGKTREFDLGDGITLTLRVSADARRLKIHADIAEDGLSKTQVNGLIDALKKIRGKMER